MKKSHNAIGELRESIEKRDIAHKKYLEAVEKTDRAAMSALKCARNFDNVKRLPVGFQCWEAN